jgi:selenide,water dikinase
VDDPEPKYGLSVTGLIDPDHIATNAGAKSGDAIILTKPLGTGIITTAAKFDACPDDVLNAACTSMATLNSGAAFAMKTIGIGPGGVHAATDITGFALLGHLYHLARASGVAIEVDSESISLLPYAEALAEEGNVTRGGKDNEAYLGEHVRFAEEIPAARRSVFFDPQTSGGLAICVDHSRLDEMLAALEAEGVATRAVIGRVVRGLPGIQVS